MNISPNFSPKFTGVYVNDSSLKNDVRKFVFDVQTYLDEDYDDSAVKRLDKMGVDVVITGTKEKDSDVVRTYFADGKNHTYKFNGPNKNFFAFDVGDALDRYPYRDRGACLLAGDIDYFAEKIANGEITAKTKKPTQAVISACPVRDHSIDEQEYPSRNLLEFDDTDSFATPEYEELAQRYGIDIFA